jgi:hypothetical protein
VWSERWKTTRDADDGENDSIITTPIMKKIHNNSTPREDIIIIMARGMSGRVCGKISFWRVRDDFHFGG